jgi:hypothetical protein
LGLFLAVYETYASDYLWDQFEALEPAPMPNFPLGSSL